jgi:hypothetical protein
MIAHCGPFDNEASPTSSFPVVSLARPAAVGSCVGRGVRPRRRGAGVRVLAHVPEDFDIVCGLVRTLEVLGVGTCFIYDPHRLIRPCYGRSYGRRLRTDLAGVFFRIRFERVASPLEFIQERDDRSIATAPDQSVTSVRFRARTGRADPIWLRSSRADCPREWSKPTARASRSHSAAVPRRASTSASPQGSSTPSASGRPRAGPLPKPVPCIPPPDAVYRA